jgi:hypothetical protein
MNRPRLICGLRVALSATCVIASVLLVALWVRSYRTWDCLNWVNGGAVSWESFDGRIQLFVSFRTIDDPDVQRGLTYKTIPGPLWPWPEQTGMARYGFHASRGGAPGRYFIQVPHWLPALLFASLAPAPWIHWRFRLRTLLIATMLIAIGLGIIMTVK